MNVAELLGVEMQGTKKEKNKRRDVKLIIEYKTSKLSANIPIRLKKEKQGKEIYTKITMQIVTRNQKTI